MAALPVVLGAIALGSTDIGRQAMGDIAKLGLKSLEKKMRNMAGNMLEKATSYGAKKIRGGSLDIYQAIGKLPHTKRGWVPPGYLGPCTAMGPCLGQ